ncbi:hypothetical protein C0J52_15194 [Blattella germanica]|nr:hypothetical protein C0J52_15194 [Blattella germanica]
MVLQQVVEEAAPEDEVQREEVALEEDPRVPMALLALGSVEDLQALQARADLVDLRQTVSVGLPQVDLEDLHLALPILTFLLTMLEDPSNLQMILAALVQEDHLDLMEHRVLVALKEVLMTVLEVLLQDLPILTCHQLQEAEDHQETTDLAQDSPLVPAETQLVVEVGILEGKDDLVRLMLRVEEAIQVDKEVLPVLSMLQVEVVIQVDKEDHQDLLVVPVLEDILEDKEDLDHFLTVDLEVLLLGHLMPIYLLILALVDKEMVAQGLEPTTLVPKDPLAMAATAVHDQEAVGLGVHALAAAVSVGLSHLVLVDLVSEAQMV